jgi:hypothetical protein
MLSLLAKKVILMQEAKTSTIQPALEEDFPFLNMRLFKVNFISIFQLECYFRPL